MAFKTFAPGVLTSSDVNTFLMRQAVITCTSSTRPSSPSEGMTIYETDTDLYATYTGTAWQYVAGYSSFAASLGGSGWTFKGHTITSYYLQLGNLVHYYGYIEWDGTGSRTPGTTPVFVDTPVTPAAGGTLRTAMLGTSTQFDDSLGQSRHGVASIDSNGVRFGPSMNNAATFSINNSITSFTSFYISEGGFMADDSGDRWTWNLWYEAA